MGVGMNIEHLFNKVTDENLKLLKFKKWCVNNVKPFTTEERWKDCDMKQKLDELGLKDD